MLIARDNSSTGLHYLHTDLLGSPIEGKVDSTGYTEHYSPWGEKISDPIQLANDVGYTGHQSDTATGLTYMQARYYDPVIGRFMAVDPIGFISAAPMSFNRYSYVLNSPLKFVDPFGLAAQQPPKIDLPTVTEEPTTTIAITTTTTEDGEVVEEITVTGKKPKQDATNRRRETLRLLDAYFQANAPIGAAIMQSQQDQQAAADYISAVYSIALAGAGASNLAIQAPRIQLASPGVCAALLISCTAPSVAADGSIKLGGKATMRVVRDLIRREERQELSQAVRSEVGKIVIPAK